MSARKSALIAAIATLAADFDENASLRAGNPGRWYARILQGFPCHLKHQPLLRINARRFEWRNTEKLRIE